MISAVGGVLKLADGSSLPLSKAIAANGFLFVSGQLGMDETGFVVEGGVAAQTQRALENIQSILQDAGASMNDVVKVTGWLTHGSDFPEFNRVYGEHFKATPPARSMVVSELLLPGARVEIEAIAVLPKS